MDFYIAPPRISISEVFLYTLIKHMMMSFGEIHLICLIMAILKLGRSEMNKLDAMMKNKDKTRNHIKIHEIILHLFIQNSVQCSSR